MEAFLSLPILLDILLLPPLDMQSYEPSIVRVLNVNFNSTERPPAQSLLTSLMPPCDEKSECSFCLEPAISSSSSTNDEPQTDVPVAVLCDHVFHAHCLKACRDVQCPICRHGMMGPSTSSAQSTNHHCEKCSAKDRLFLCLSCAEINCGPYEPDGHGYVHAKETGHYFGLELDNPLNDALNDSNVQRVWDFANALHASFLSHSKLALNKKKMRVLEYVDRLLAAYSDDRSGRRKLVVGAPDKTSTASSTEAHVHYEQEIYKALSIQNQFQQNQKDTFARESSEKLMALNLHDLVSERNEFREANNRLSEKIKQNQRKLDELNREIVKATMVNQRVRCETERLEIISSELDRENGELNQNYADLVAQVTDLSFHLKSIDQMKELELTEDEIQQSTIQTKLPKEHGRKRRNG